MKRMPIKRLRVTFTVPENIFVRFASAVPEGERSALITKLIEIEVGEREQLLAEACIGANNDARLSGIETDFLHLPDTIVEEFDGNDWLN